MTKTLKKKCMNINVADYKLIFSPLIQKKCLFYMEYFYCFVPDICLGLVVDIFPQDTQC